MNAFDLELQEAWVRTGNQNIPLVVVGAQQDLWSKGNSLTAYWGWAQP